MTIKIKKADAFKAIKKEKDNSIDLLITSPPYNIGKEYETKKSFDNYLKPYEEFANDLFKKIKKTGSICWQVGNYVHKGEIIPLDIPFYSIFANAGFKLRNRIIWHFEHGLHASNRFSGRYETILWFTKSDKYIFNLDQPGVRIPSKYPGKRNKNGKITGNPLGKNPSDFMQVTQQDWDRLIWNMPNVKANHPEKTSHPAQFPIELAQRCVLALTKINGLVLDPFCGTATSLVASSICKRFSKGYESNQDYIKLAKKRIKEFQNGTIKIRKLGKPIHKPKKTDKVAQIPFEWSNKKSIY